MFILLFLISCSSIEDPTEDPKREKHSRAELVGEWAGRRHAYMGYDYRSFIVDSDGNISFQKLEYYPLEYYYKGKLNDTFYYPYTVEISIEGYTDVNNNTYIKERHTGTITFSSSSNATGSCDELHYSYRGWRKRTIDNFEKQKRK